MSEEFVNIVAQAAKRLGLEWDGPCGSVTIPYYVKYTDSREEMTITFNKNDKYESLMELIDTTAYDIFVWEHMRYANIRDGIPSVHSLEHEFASRTEAISELLDTVDEIIEEINTNRCPSIEVDLEISEELGKTHQKAPQEQRTIRR